MKADRIPPYRNCIIEDRRIACGLAMQENASQEEIEARINEPKNEESSVRFQPKD